MTSENREKIISDDYADLIISYNGDPAILEKYKDHVVTIINFFLAVVHVPVSQITEDIVSILGYAVLPSLFGLVSQSSMEASGIRRLRNMPNFDLRGRGVLIGIVDSGIDFTNPIFQYADKTTKIVSIWDQTIHSSSSPQNMFYGTEYTREQINEALKSEDPYSIVPSRDMVGHGTMIAGIAAGNEQPESGFYGVAPDAELVVVKLKPAKSYLKQFFRFPEDAICYQENDLIYGYQYLFNYAFQLQKPMAVCVALDTAQYAHDGRGTTSLWLSYQGETEGIAIVTAAGNEGNSKRHYYGIIDKTIGYDMVELHVGDNEPGFSMEIWGNSPNLFSIDIMSPFGEYIPRITVRLNETRVITFIFEATVIYVDYQLIETQSGEQLILARFTKPSPGIWRFKVYARGIIPMDFNIWLPMNNFISTDTYFIKADPSVTLLSLACARSLITVTAYNPEDGSLFMDASRGYTRIGVIKPDIAAPGVNMIAPTLQHSFNQVSGTSAAAAHTTGVAAMLLEWGMIKGNYVNMRTQDVKIFMIRGAKRDNLIKYPNRDWGYGILDIYNVFDNLRR